MQKLLEDMIKERVNNGLIYLNEGRADLEEKESFEAKYLETFIPKMATKEEIEMFLNENYLNGIEQKMMGTVIKQIKNYFNRVDGKMVSELVKERII